MTTVDPSQLSAIEIADAYRRRTLSPVEVTEAIVERIEAVDPAIHAFFTRTPERALSDARASEARFMRGEPLGSLDGVPYSVKDLEQTEGVRTTFGSWASRDNVPAQDGPAAGRLRAAGGVLLGKTATPEDGYKDTSDTLIAPEPENPWDRSRTTGGSSGGAAAAVAAGLGPIAHGSDGAGSIRIPSALCGVVGLKPTLGRVPVWPQPFYRDSVAHNGPIARSVADVAVALDALAGPDQRDPWSVMPNPARGFALESAEPDERPLRIGFSIDFGYGVTDPEVAAAVVATVSAIADERTQVKPTDPPWSDPSSAQLDWWSREFAGIFGEAAAERPDTLEPAVHELVRAGKSAPGDSDFRYRRMRGAMHERQLELFSAVDYFISPAMPLTAWPRGEDPGGIEGAPFPGSERGRNYLLFPFNLTGNPAISIPCGLSAEGLPIGLQIVARHYDEVGLLRMARRLEASIGFIARPALTA
jgi:Asp-tRNA(Asn)/Glu-tRNA(Gln) amidotransferase A subunit family amidase